MNESGNFDSENAKIANERMAKRSALIRRLEGLSPAEQGDVLLDLVCAQALAVMRIIQPGTTTPVRADQPFQGIGFDSLAAVELQTG